MDNNELLTRIKEKDKDAFLQFMQSHGEKLYYRLLSRLGDRDLADKAFRDALISFYKTLIAEDSGDPVEALLFGYADRACEEILEGSLETVISDTMADAAELTDVSAEEGASAPVETPTSLAGPQPEENVPSPAPEQAPDVHEQPEEEEVDNEPAVGGNGLFGLGIGVLSLGIIVTVWVILGLLMDMQILPEIDLGYSWFNANIAPWF